MANKTSKYRYGDKVRVATGVIDPDFNTNIEGWSGEIDEIELLGNGSWMYLIVWDEDTLLIAGDDFVSKCEEKSLDYEYINLSENELELIESKMSNTNETVFIA